MDDNQNPAVDPMNPTPEENPTPDMPAADPMAEPMPETPSEDTPAM